ncbi:MAG TPA: chemotaxis protein CheW [Nitrospira sp.]|nr:chemotaxis protein CheW [Nitrospira sp.]
MMEEARAEQLPSDAQDGPDHPGLAGPSRVCLITLGGESFAIQLAHVREVFKLELVTPVPGMPASLVGVANLRGTIVPIADLRPSLEVSMVSTPKYVVVVQQGVRQMGILIDGVPEIRTVYPDALLTDTTSGTARRPFLSGLLNIENRLSVILEVSGVLASVESETMQPSGAS